MDRKTWRTTWGPTESDATERLTLSLFKDNSGRDFFFHFIHLFIKQATLTPGLGLLTAGFVQLC